MFPQAFGIVAAVVIAIGVCVPDHTNYTDFDEGGFNYKGVHNLNHLPLDV